MKPYIEWGPWKPCRSEKVLLWVWSSSWFEVLGLPPLQSPQRLLGVLFHGFAQGPISDNRSGHGSCHTSQMLRKNLAFIMSFQLHKYVIWNISTLVLRKNCTRLLSEQKATRISTRTLMLSYMHSLTSCCGQITDRKLLEVRKGYFDSQFQVKARWQVHESTVLLATNMRK